MNYIQRAKISGLVTASYIGGIIAGGLLFAATTMTDGYMGGGLFLLLFIGVGLVLAFPLYIAFAVLAFVLAEQIARKPVICTGTAFLTAAVFSVVALPSEGGLLSLATVGVLCAALSGGLFLLLVSRCEIRVHPTHGGLTCEGWSKW